MRSWAECGVDCVGAMEGVRRGKDVETARELVLEWW